MHYFRRLRKTEKKQEDDNDAQNTHRISKMQTKENGEQTEEEKRDLHRYSNTITNGINYLLE